MVDIVNQFNGRVNRISIDLNLTVESKLHVCLAQLPKPPIDAIVTDRSRPAAVAAAVQLLAGGGQHDAAALSEMAPGNQAVLVVFPEFSFGSEDWEALDVAIRQSARPLIVIGGFGATVGQWIIDWAREETDGHDTHRRLAWDQTGPAADGISSVRRVNGGWCWVHVPGETHCIAYLKTIAEQNVEAVLLPDLQFGRSITHLRFNDIDLFPLICADLLQLPGEHADSAQARIAEALQDIAGDRPAMVVGSLLQHGYNINWVRAIDSLLVNVLAGRPGLVALANVADDHVFAIESEDQWRSLTGVFGKWNELTRGQANLPCGRRVSTAGVVGAVIRHSDPMVTSGVADWGPYGPVDGKFVWHADMLCPLSDAGLVAPLTLPPQPHTCEIARFLRRYPGEANWSPRLGQGSAEITRHLKSGGPARAAQLLNELLNGPGAGQADPDALHEMTERPAAEFGFHGLATLATLDGIEWQVDSGKQGQLLHNGSGRHILVWRDARKTKSQMRAVLSVWQQQGDGHPELIVLAQSRFGDIDEGAVSEARRDDLSAAPVTIPGINGGLVAPQDDYTAPRGRRRLAVVNLAHVSSVYAEYQEGVDDAPSVNALQARINGALP